MKHMQVLLYVMRFILFFTQRDVKLTCFTFTTVTLKKFYTQAMHDAWTESGS